MRSIRKLAGANLSLGILALMIGGCQVEQRIPPAEPLSQTPIAVDPAMARRDWQPSWALYTNDAVLAWPDYAPLRAKPLPIYEAMFVESGEFLGNTAYTPVGMFIDPPFRMVQYKSLATPPTYSAMPPQTPSSEDTLAKDSRW